MRNGKIASRSTRILRFHNLGAEFRFSWSEYLSGVGIASLSELNATSAMRPAMVFIFRSPVASAFLSKVTKLLGSLVTLYKDKLQWTSFGALLVNNYPRDRDRGRKAHLLYWDKLQKDGLVQGRGLQGNRGVIMLDQRSTRVPYSVYSHCRNTDKLHVLRPNRQL
jgi:hypothetical protein